MRRGRKATRQLTHGALVLSARPVRSGALVRLLALAAALAVGAGAATLYWRGALQDAHQLAATLHDNQGLAQALEQARLSLRLSQARGQELERQIDALNQRLHEAQEELTFFRKARDAKK